MKHFALAAISAIVIIAAASPAAAATVVLNTTIDLRTPRFTNYWEQTLAMPVQVKVGDTLNWTISFARGDRLQLGNSTTPPVGLEWVLGGLMPSSGEADSSSGRFSLTGVEGDYANPTLTTGYSGALAFGALTNYTDSSFTFGGLNMVLNYTAGTATLFNQIYFQVARGQASVVTAAVPEPATWGLMVVGFGLMAAGLRTRRRHTAVTYA